MKRLRALLMLFPIAFAVPALSQDDPPNFSDLDANSDGYVSAEEAAADMRVANGFSEADTDRDGYLSAEEFSAAWILKQE